ncbi:unnamed protein product [Sphagnum balticum]
MEKEKIVEGINKMYTVHIKIKEIYKHNLDVIRTLTLVAEYKRIFAHKTASIKAKMRPRRHDDFMANFEAQAVDFYQALLEKVRGVANEP